jgi:hypothetical protein
VSGGGGLPQVRDAIRGVAIGHEQPVPELAFIVMVARGLIYDYIAADNPAATDRVAPRIAVGHCHQRTGL